MRISIFPQWLLIYCSCKVKLRNYWRQHNMNNSWICTCSVYMVRMEEEKEINKNQLSNLINQKGLGLHFTDYFFMSLALRRNVAKNARFCLLACHEKCFQDFLTFKTSLLFQWKSFILQEKWLVTFYITVKQFEKSWKLLTKSYNLNLHLIIMWMWIKKTLSISHPIVISYMWKEREEGSIKKKESRKKNIKIH